MADLTISTRDARARIVAGQIDQKINEAISDIMPGAHVVAVTHEDTRAGWAFHLALPPLPVVELTDAAIVGDDAWLEHLIDQAEEVVRVAKAKLLNSWGIEVPGE